MLSLQKYFSLSGKQFYSFLSASKEKNFLTWFPKKSEGSRLLIVGNLLLRVELYNAQLAMKELIEAHLRRIERDTSGLPVRLYPFTRERKADEPKVIVIDPSISFGRPVLVGTGIATTIIAQRYKAGESVGELAEDYGRSRSEIEEAIRCELWLEAA